MTDLRPQTISDLRHDLRTPVNHIVGYAEMLLEDAVEAKQVERRQALEVAIGAAQDVLSLINTALPPSRDEIPPQDIVGLYDSLREPQGRILASMQHLLAQVGTADDGLRKDIARIIAAAERMVERGAPGSAVSETAQPHATQPQEPPPRVEAADSTSSARVLVVDDVDDNREVLRRRLERQGYGVDSAANGREALEMVAAGDYDLILLDVLMPEIDGYGVLGSLKDTPGTRDIPVIMISALDDVASVVRCIERGAEDYLPKPFDPVLLRARISACLEKKRLRDQEVEYLERVQQVIEAASAVEAGEYQLGTLGDLANRADALGRLARVFDGMAVEVRAREERLQERVHDLRREIEAARVTAPNGHSVDGGNLKTGQQFAGRYEILAVLGSGGMGSVYHARDVELGDEVAVKTLRPELVTDETLIERFKLEIRLARKLSHRNVVRTHDLGQWAGVYYLTMELVEGITVRHLIDTRGQLGVSASLAIGAQLAEALQVAHEQGVIHRDIKPQNLLLDADAVLKVMDFGIAQLAERTSSITETGLTVGTPAYMPPEQLLAEGVDGRSDLYAAGVVLYECLTGTIPFEAPSPIALIAKVLNQEPAPPAARNPDVPPALSALVQQLLAKKPQDRIQSAAELASRLHELH